MTVNFLTTQAKTVAVEFSTDKKLAVAAVAYFTTVGLLLLGKVTPSTYETITLSVTGLYFGAHVGQKWVEGKTNGTPQPPLVAPAKD